MLFADSDLARRIEAAERRLTTDVAARIRERVTDPRRVLVAEVAGGAVVHVGEDTPFNKAIGMGLDGPLEAADRDALGAIEAEHDRRGGALQAEVATLADASVTRELSRRGYQLVGFENVLGLLLDEDALPERGRAEAFDLEVSESDPASFREWLDAVVGGFAHPDPAPGGPSHESYPRDALERVMTDMARTPGFVRYVARVGGAIAGGATLRSCDGVAQLCGTATLPPFRRRGVQTAFMRRRLRDARGAGCDLAVITTQPGSRSQWNAQRSGFTLLYCRAILVRSPRPR